MKIKDVIKVTEPEEYLSKPKEKKQQRLDHKVKASTRRIDTKSYKEERWN